ncbi:uncharacterized protein PRCAT00000656001 [Priceomyces carsonii]|uniref:uncharacterized protein n=1 Tax=Priceomyces carsonii TaxID=28549 RepID=UPI002EDBB7C2|nr:unnamed protein product [Priceomyces carsonii]
MSSTDIPLHLEVSNRHTPVRKHHATTSSVLDGKRKRSNSQSNVVQIPTTVTTSQKKQPPKRGQFQSIVTLIPLNDTFTKKQLSVPYYPDTRKLGRPAGAKIKPDTTNGYFDSRVLSRNHAAMFMDPSTGKLMLKDLGSSNGTYVNEERIGTEPVEIKIGDIIYLGFNIQVDTNHKQITARVENINVISNFLQPPEGSYKSDTVEGKYIDFVQDIYNKVQGSNSKHTYGTKSEERLLFDSALYGDINPSIEDDLLGLYTKTSTGIFNNSHITSTGNMESLINVLSVNFAKVKQQNCTLATIEQFLINYQANVNDLNSSYLNQELKKGISTVEEQVSNEKKISQRLKDELKEYKEQSAGKVENLTRRLKDLEDEKKSLHNEMKTLYSTFINKEQKSINEDNADDFNFDIISPQREESQDKNGSFEKENSTQSQSPSENGSTDLPSNENHSIGLQNDFRQCQLQSRDSRGKNSNALTPPVSDNEENRNENRESSDSTELADSDTNTIGSKSKLERGTRPDDVNNIKSQSLALGISIVLLVFIFQKLSN